MLDMLLITNRLFQKSKLFTYPRGPLGARDLISLQPHPDPDPSQEPGYHLAQKQKHNSFHTVNLQTVIQVANTPEHKEKNPA